ncbi:MAG: methyltransferase family protein [Candidatus Hermodarchaeota archaeon]
MSSEHTSVTGKEHPLTHQIIISSAILFLLFWILDSFIFNLSTGLNIFIPLIFRITVFCVFLGLAIIVGVSSHNALFRENPDSSSLIKTEIYARVRHPLYLSMLLAYLALALLTLSIISFAIWILIFILFNKMATYEEKDLENIFGNEYTQYRKRVPKWIPKLVLSKEFNK